MALGKHCTISSTLCPCVRQFIRQQWFVDICSLHSLFPVQLFAVHAALDIKYDSHDARHTSNHFFFYIIRRRTVLLVQCGVLFKVLCAVLMLKHTHEITKRIFLYRPPSRLPLFCARQKEVMPDAHPTSSIKASQINYAIVSVLN